MDYFLRLLYEEYINWIVGIFRRNCLFKPVIEKKKKIEGKKKRGRRRKELLDDFNP